MLPKTVKVGPFTYRIFVTDDILPDKAGQCKIEQLRILIAPDQAPLFEKDTLLHEVLHACFATMNLSDVVNNDVEEQIVHRLATILLQVLRSNPKLVEYLRD